MRAWTDEPELPAAPDAAILSIVLVTPGARGHLPELKRKGFAGYLVKPLRQSSLAERILAGESQSMEMDAPVPAEPSAPPRAPLAAPEEAATPHGAVTRVLLAEDNPINAMLTRELLRRRGYHVTGVTCGEEAVAAMEQDSFDLVLTDIHMPGLDGIEATRRIRAQ